MRIFDCFTFYNEFDILELRLAELWDTVDYFVISEANTTHQNNPKPFYLKDNWDRIKKYESKIRHVMLDDMPMSPDTWVNERHQRRELSRGLTDLQPDDIVIVSDCDEIPRPAAIEAIKEDANNYDRYILAIPLNYFKLNFMMIHPVFKQNNIAVVRGRAFTDPQQAREFTFHRGALPLHYADNDFCVIEHGGWHFTYFGHTEFAKNKLLNFAHAESRSLADTVDVDYMIANKVGLLGFNYHERFEYIQVDDYFPQTVVNNPEKYKDMIVQGATKNIYEIYPE
jgi:hypothetical protein